MLFFFNPAVNVISFLHIQPLWYYITKKPRKTELNLRKSCMLLWHGHWRAAFEPRQADETDARPESFKASFRCIDSHSMEVINYPSSKFWSDILFTINTLRFPTTSIPVVLSSTRQVHKPKLIGHPLFLAVQPI